MKNVLYLTRNGLLEPLGQSQVLPYLRGLSDEYSITVMTREKAEDWADRDMVDRIAAECRVLGIDWRPNRFLAKPKLFAPIWDIWNTYREALRLVRSNDFALVHARSYLPAAVARMVWKKTRVPFIFDMRALWPEEMITAGRLKRGGAVHKVISRIERSCLRDAAAVVSLTHAAARYLKQHYADELKDKAIAVIPTCADLDRFALAPRPVEAPFTYGCAGTIVSGWFRTDLLAAWFGVAAQRDTQARFEILTRDDAAAVRQLVDPDGSLGERLTIAARRPDEMSAALRNHSVSAMFFTTGISKLGSSPTRMAEILGCGIPVVANSGVGDVEAIIRDNKVGVILDEPSEADKALAELTELMTDPELPDRCRAAAESIFSLSNGTRAYRKLYRSIIGGEG